MSFKNQKKMLFKTLIAKLEERNKAIVEFAASKGGLTFAAPSKRLRAVPESVMVHPAIGPHPGRWQTTRFVGDEPIAHVHSTSYLDAVKVAVVDYGADLTQASFAGVAEQA